MSYPTDETGYVEPPHLFATPPNPTDLSPTSALSERLSPSRLALARHTLVAPTHLWPADKPCVLLPSTHLPNPAHADFPFLARSHPATPRPVGPTAPRASASQPPQSQPTAHPSSSAFSPRRLPPPCFSPAIPLPPTTTRSDDSRQLRLVPLHPDRRVSPSLRSTPTDRVRPTSRAVSCHDRLIAILV